MPRYTVKDGHSFDRGGGQTAVAGDEIELAADVAALHPEKVERVQTPAPGHAADEET